MDYGICPVSAAFCKKISSGSGTFCGDENHVSDAFHLEPPKRLGKSPERRLVLDAYFFLGGLSDDWLSTIHFKVFCKAGWLS